MWPFAGVGVSVRGGLCVCVCVGGGGSARALVVTHGVPSFAARMFCASSTVNVCMYVRGCEGACVRACMRACVHAGGRRTQVLACVQQLRVEVQKDASDTLRDAIAAIDEQWLEGRSRRFTLLGAFLSLFLAFLMILRIRQ